MMNASTDLNKIIRILDFLSHEYPRKLGLVVFRYDQQAIKCRINGKDHLIKVSECKDTFDMLYKIIKIMGGDAEHE